MKTKTAILIFFSQISFLICSAQTHTSKALQDSVFKKYVENGAFHYALNSHERQRYLDSAIAITPDNSYLWQQRAMPLFKQGKYELGMTYLDKAVELNPTKYLDYRAFMKCIFSKTYADAITDFKKAYETYGDKNVMDHSYDFYIGICYLQLSKYKEAKEHLQKSIDNQLKKNGESYVHFLDEFYLGVVQYEMEDYGNAIISFDKALAKYEHFSDAKYYKSFCLKRLEKTEEASMLFVSAMTDLKDGSTINEDNSIYERYPYQIKMYYFGDQNTKNKK